MNYIKNIQLLSVGLLFLFLGVANGQVFINSSLTGTVDDTSVPFGWTLNGSGTADTNDINTPTTFVHSGNPVNGWPSAPVYNPTNSNNGGTWISANNSQERFSQSVSGFAIGQLYNILWEQTNYGIVDSIASTNIVYHEDGITFQAMVDGGVGNLSGATMNKTALWTETSVSFVATQNQHNFIFRRTGPGSYASIDNIRLVTVPEPSSILLLGVSFFYVIKQRKRS